MNVFSFNCRGLKDHRRLQTIVNNCIRKLSDLANLCMCLKETKISNLSNNHLKILAHYHLSYILYPADGQSGELLTIFPENFTVLRTHKSSNTISIHFSQHNFTLTNIYIKPTDYHLQQFLSDILAIEQFQCDTHIICGDFNALPSADCTSNCHIANNDFRLLVIQSSSPFKIIAYADDVTCCLKINSLQHLYNTINIFSSVTNLYLNQQKTDILCSGSLPSGFLSVPTVKILGVEFSVNTSALQLNSAILQANKSRLFCNPYNTFLARAKNVETFVMQKLIYQIRHKYVLKMQLERIDNIFVDSIWLGRKHNMKKTILQKPWASMGIGLKNFTQVITAAKTIDYRNFLYSNPTSNQYRLFRNFKLFSNMRRLLRTFNCTTLSLDNTSQVLLRRSSQILVLTPLTRTREVYRFLSSSNRHDSLMRLTQLASRINYPPDMIFLFLRRLWKHKSYAAFEKNYLYQFFMNCYMDKTIKFEHGWTDTPFCCFCGSAEETFYHLLSECPNIPHLNFFPTLGHPQLNFHLSDDYYPFKRLIALLICSWSNDSHKLKKYFINCVKLRNPTISLNVSL